ncbi:MAG: 50S ribosomal protein L4 [Candidatus Nealsonbacteria bacterium]|nr:50S ribosomal protein L4 [Candidatus Nealsonbacteria bacterium]
MKVSVYNQKGEELKKIDVSDDVFNVEPNFDLLHQVVVSQMSNRRQGTAHTKDRGDVSGGGKKPWRQKGTGRARHGSTRSPIWKGGGVTFGPRSDKNYKRVIPKLMKRKALFMVLSAKLKDNEMKVLDKIELNNHKTKGAIEVLNNFPEIIKKNTLLILPDTNKSVLLGFRNIPKIELMQAKDLNALDLLSFKNIIIPEASIKVIEDTF